MDETWIICVALLIVVFCTIGLSQSSSKAAGSRFLSEVNLPKREAFVRGPDTGTFAEALPEVTYANAGNFSNPSGTRQTNGYGFGNELVPGLVPSTLRTVSGSCAYNVADTPGIQAVSYHLLNASKPMQARLEVLSGEEIPMQNKEYGRFEMISGL